MCLTPLSIRRRGSSSHAAQRYLRPQLRRKTAGDIAATPCAALVSLSRISGLLRQPNGTSTDDLEISDDTRMADTWLNGNKQDMTEEQREWINW